MPQTRRIILRSGEDGWIVAEAPSLPGCVSQGRTREEAIANVTEAIELTIESMRELGEPIPDDNGIAEIVAVPVPPRAA